MSNIGNPGQLAEADRRKHRRYDLRYPVHVTYCTGKTVGHLNAVSKNASIDGMLLEVGSIIPVSSSVSFVITLKSAQLSRSIEIAGEGTVVRVGREPSEAGYEIAIACTRPLAQVEAQFPLAG